MAAKTPLYDKHLSLSAKMVEFAGFLMPLQYTGIAAEHQTVRSRVGIFDLTHMGEILVSGPKAEEFLNYVTTNDVSKLISGAIQYSFLTNEAGGVIDDILIYRVPEGFYLVVNAANTAKDYQWLLSKAPGGVTVQDLSQSTALIAIQGPNALPVTEKALEAELAQLDYYHFRDLPYHGEQIRVSRTGYTGEDGFEVYLSPQLAPRLWDELIAVGLPYGIQPVGLGARDTLRLEMRMPLYGNELTEEESPLAAGLDRFVVFDKGDFIGRTALMEQETAGISLKLVGFVLRAKGIPRHGYNIIQGGRIIGRVTSGTMSPSLQKGIGLGYVDSAHAKAGSIIEIEIRRQRVPAEIIKGRFVTKK
ncbi:MAG: glycine cleavage system aminomethyltransferase GcvT [Firmicutes bacterium]|mgnify:CR=1 FL=1|jgi:aminomethyltransferase|nr:glycine cleavage system aminomethyltransferase GcvT [Bacillota bacterium]NLL87360.1 glycine cleavage system aminomethyltransferase GcvT [Bacillota bacterium]HKM17381.1 glycine cleavage system aminomethyltransferase GcvT [Limnochordia bacterium]